MGYGLPAAIAAKLADPTRTVVNFAGDGCFLMTGQELATAVQYGLAIVTIVANNGMYGTIRAHQERQYPERVVGTHAGQSGFRRLRARLRRPRRDGRAHGGFQAPPSSARSTPASPSIIELKIDPEALTPRQTLSDIRAAGKRRRGEARRLEMARKSAIHDLQECRMQQETKRIDSRVPPESTLVGQIRRFGPHGVLYEIIAMVGEENARIRVIETGEELDYPVRKIMEDPDD